MYSVYCPWSKSLSPEANAKSVTNLTPSVTNPASSVTIRIPTLHTLARRRSATDLQLQPALYQINRQTSTKKSPSKPLSTTMPAKRGRPLSGESDSAAVNHRREQVRERVRQHCLRQRAMVATDRNISTAQQEQGDSVVNLTPVEEEEAAATLVLLGMRKSTRPRYTTRLFRWATTAERRRCR